MKRTTIAAIAALALSSAFVACGGSGTTTGAGDTTAHTTAAATPQDPVEAAIGRFLTDSVAPAYSPGEVTIPSITIIHVDKSDTASVRVLGDFWVFNYNVAGDTLKTVSGGSHPGMMHLRHDGQGYTVTAFDQVGDGASFMPTARKIFGAHYEAFMAVNANDTTREAARAQGIARYVQEHGLKVTMYQDYDWPAKKLSLDAVR